MWYYIALKGDFNYRCGFLTLSWSPTAGICWESCCHGPDHPVSTPPFAWWHRRPTSSRPRAPAAAGQGHPKGQGQTRVSWHHMTHRIRAKYSDFVTVWNQRMCALRSHSSLGKCIYLFLLDPMLTKQACDRVLLSMHKKNVSLSRQPFWCALACAVWYCHWSVEIFYFKFVLCDCVLYLRVSLQCVQRRIQGTGHMG